MSALSAVTKPLSVRLLTGEVREISCPAEISYQALYQLIRSELPLEIRPFSIDQMNLMCGGELVPDGMEKAVLSDEEYVLLLDAERYHGCIEIYHNALHVQDRVLLNGRVHYEDTDYHPICVDVERICGRTTEAVMGEWHLYDLHTRRFLDLTDIPLEWIGDEEDRTLRLHFPEDRHTLSMEEMEAILLRGIDSESPLSLAGQRAVSRLVRKGLEKIDVEWGAWLHGDMDLDEDGIPHGLPEDFEA